MRKAVWITLAVVAAAALTAGVLAVVVHRPAPIPPAVATSTAYVDAWNDRDWAAMAKLVDAPPPDFADVNAAALTDVGATAATFTVTPPVPAAGGMDAPFTARVALGSMGTWQYEGEVPLVLVHRHWMVKWSTRIIHPAFAPGLHLAVTHTAWTAAPILAADGRPLAALPDGSELVTGLAHTYAAQINGRPAGDVVLEDATGHVVTPLYHYAGTAPQPLVTTIDPAVQLDADRVLAGVAHPAALVAIDTTTEVVRAVISHPDGGYPRALVGTYPPGSTFKVVTSTAALEAGWTPASPIACPPSITVGKTFTNAEHEQYGTIDFQRAFAQSCNTAFIGIASKLTDAQLEAAAATYGIGQDWPFPVPHFGGQLPPPASTTEHAADAIGQGRVAVSPLEMASIAAAVANGSWQPPRLVAAEPVTVSHPLPPSVDADLKLFMRSVVTDGTGTAANIPGDPVYGKTGTAEFGTGNPPQTHAWFIGWRGTTAFAVVVEDGGFGGSAAAPLAAQFLQNLP